MKRSIRRQFTFIFVGLMAGVILLCLLANSLLLGRYYQRMKERALFDAYDTISQAAKGDGYGTVQFQTELEEVCRRNNIAICIMDMQSQIKYISSNGGQDLERRLIGYIFDLPYGEADVIKKGEDYTLQKTMFADHEYLELCGRLDSGISYIMRTPFESIQESANIANRFFLYVGCFGALIGGVIIWLVSRKITGPILKLNQISKRMVELDFDAKYEEKAHNEIDLLGENMNQLSQSLEQTISELKTANNELKRDIARKEEIDEMRKEFLANVSHELKTPIALIQGYAEGLQVGVNDDPESRNFYCEVIVDEAAKMNGMVQKLLTLNQIEFGRDTVDMERFDVVELVKNYLQSVAILTQSNGIKVKMDQYAPVYVWADEYKTEEVFANYYTNAVHYCGGSKEIRISLVKNGPNVRVEVFNTGDPIPEESLPHLWDKFYKVDKARTREYGGSGVGLSIVKAIMDSMHYPYGVENCKDGVRFWFELECVQEQ